MLKITTKITQGTELWTASRLVAAILMAPLGYIVALIYTRNYSELNEQFGIMFWLGCTVCGLWLGWRILGKDPGDGRGKSFGKGLFAGISLFLLCVIWQSTLFTYDNLTAASFDSPEIIPGRMMTHIIRFFREFLEPPILFVCGVGGLFAGRIVGLVNYYWR
ncbi:MAG: TrgA family protein [Pseudomonadota bacterium]